MVDRFISTDAKGNRMPLYYYGNSNIDSKQFLSWYADDPTFNIPFPVSLQASNAHTCDSLVYAYNNTNFFPIDGMGFGNSFDYSGNELPTHKDHNFAFTFAISMRFTYQGYETFNFTGDDDIWVFINNQVALVISCNLKPIFIVKDIGGVHPALSGSLDLTYPSDGCNTNKWGPCVAVPSNGPPLAQGPCACILGLQKGTLEIT